jgi:hypothetical protein
MAFEDKRNKLLKRAITFKDTDKSSTKKSKQSSNDTLSDAQSLSLKSKSSADTNQFQPKSILKKPSTTLLKIRNNDLSRNNVPRRSKTISAMER